MLELHGITVACSAWRYLLEICEGMFTIMTDSKAVEGLYKKFVKIGIPSDIPRINKFFDEFFGLRFDIVYAKGISNEIAVVDYISRYDNLPDCAGCSICELSDEVFMGKKLSCKISQITEQLNSLEKSESMVGAVFAPRYNYERLKGNLSELLSNVDYLTDMQKHDDQIVKLRQFLNGEIKNVQKNPTARTLYDNGAFLRNGVIYLPTRRGDKESDACVVPLQYVDVCAKTIHNTIGCRSRSAFLMEMNLCFKFIPARANKMINRYYEYCSWCMALCRPSSMVKELKEIPVPTSVGGRIEIDEIHRTDMDMNSVNIFMASESLIKFVVLYVVKGNLNAKKFTRLIKRAIEHLSKGREIVVVSLDKASAHTAAFTKERLDIMLSWIFVSQNPLIKIRVRLLMGELVQ